MGLIDSLMFAKYSENNSEVSKTAAVGPLADVNSARNCSALPARGKFTAVAEQRI
jgi:hypothetical protein